MPTKILLCKWLCDSCSDLFDAETDCHVHERSAHKRPDIDVLEQMCTRLDEANDNYELLDEYERVCNAMLDKVVLMKSAAPMTTFGGRQSPASTTSMCVIGDGDFEVEEASSPSPKCPQQLHVNEAGGDRSVKRRKRESTVGRKPVTCDVCAKTFTRHDRMMRHKEIAHPIHQSDASVEHAPPVSPTWPREREALAAAETENITAQTFVCNVLYML
ncbi:unnamed protein product [Sphagnum balticum]